MDYQFVAKYNLQFKIPENSPNLYVKYNEEIYEYRLFHTKNVFKYNEKSIIAYKTKDITIVMYARKLEFYKNDKLFKKFHSTTDIIDNNGIFLLKYKNNMFIVNEVGCTAFCSDKKMIYFTAQGDVYYTDVEMEHDESSCKCYECNHCLRKPNQFYKGHLIEDKLGKIKIFNEDSIPIIVIDNKYFCYRENCQIKDIVAMSRFEVDYKDIVVVLTLKAVYLIYRNIIIKQEVMGFIQIVPERFVIHNFIKEHNIYDMISLFNLFKTVDIHLEKTFETLLCKILISNRDNPNEYYQTFIKKQSQLTLCKAYKLIDERGKIELLNYIDFEQLSAEELLLILPYNQERYEHFVDICIKEGKEYLVKEYYTFLAKTNKEKPLLMYALEKNILLASDNPDFQCLVELEFLEQQYCAQK